MSVTYSIINNDIKVSGIGDYSLARTFDCGQCFRFEMINENTVGGVAFGRYLEICQPDDDTLILKNTTKADFENIWRGFLALDEDYEEINRDVMRSFSGLDGNVMESAVKFGHGIRILHQDMWEAVCSFIISQNNNIPRIKKIIRAMSEKYGEPISVLCENGEVRTEYSFPTPLSLYNAGEAELYELKVGFRAKYIFDCAERIVTGKLSLDTVCSLDTEHALASLMEVKGIGLKVASCALLFGFNKTDVFPIDVWIKRIIAKYFPSGLDVSALGAYAGIGQQYLFYYVRYINPNLE